MRRPSRGEVWLAPLGQAEKPRPIIIIGRDDEDPPWALTTYLPVTSKGRNSQYEVDLSEVRCLDNPKESVANAQSINTIQTFRLKHKLGQVPDVVMAEIDKAVAFALGLDGKVFAKL
jgi:mRNA interferase MazF